MKMPVTRSRLLLLAAALTVWGAVIVARLVYLQVVQHEQWEARAARQQERTVSLSPVRGAIRDREGRILAQSVMSRSIYADPTAVVDAGTVAKKLASIDDLELDARSLEKRLSAKSEFAWVARQVSDETAAAIEQMELPGIYSLDEPSRVYPQETLAAPLIGFVSIDGEGLGGAELASDRWARGHASKVTLLRDARRGTYQVGADTKAVDGLDVHLTIDEVVQYIAESAVQNAVDRYRAAGGTAVVVEPSSGAVLAVASVPTFNPNQFGDYPPSRWRNRAVQDLYEPGSTFKIVTAAAAIEEGLVTPSQLIDCEQGFIEIAGRRVREHDSKRYGLMSFEDVLVNSSNVGTIKVGLALGPERMYRWFRRFGFGEPTGIQLPGEAGGILRPVERWSKLSNAILSIGQEIGTTSLQMTQAAATIANGGVMKPLHVIDRVVDAEGQVVWEQPPVAGERIVSERTAALLNEMLKSVVTRGTGTNAALAEHAVAGKTGTAQKAGRHGYVPGRYVSSFVGWVPADRPRLVILVTIDEPRGAYYGGVVAAPVFREIAEASLRYLEVEPSVPTRKLALPSGRLATFSQSPPAGELPPAGGAPDLHGLDARSAAAIAVAAGWDIRLEGDGVVTRQIPPAGVAREDRVLRVHLGPLSSETKG